ncbi:MAG: polyphosphate kinase 1 [Planctomycetota bacterium]|jgi:polyphosphate kinase|nr:polyphosphate kinase 1 [Planctomycetota bacterium]
MKKSPPPMPDAPLIDRELSWVDFNFRVLAEAENPDVPLLERLKFIAIVSSNLDEFTQVRVAGLLRKLRDGDNAPRPVLRAIRERFDEMQKRQQTTLVRDLLPQLSAQGVQLVERAAFTAADREYLLTIYENAIAPVLTPLAIDPGHPFPLLTSGALYLLFTVASLPEAENKLFRRTTTILMQIPGGLDRFYQLPSPDPKTVRFVMLEDIIRIFATSVLSGYEITDSYLFRVLRDAETVIDDDAAKDLLGAVDEAVRGRRWGEPVAIHASERMPDDVLNFLRGSLHLPDDQQIYRLPLPLNRKGFFELASKVKRADLSNPAFPPQPHPQLAGDDIFAAIRAQDHILTLPYQKFDPITEMVKKAANDPQALAIKITLYRVAGDSPLIKALINAARLGKQVTALVELRARFDEHNNIAWARALDAAGAHVIYGVVGYKTHSKVMLIVRHEDDGIRRYVHLATGNYNDKTARLYTDIGLFTCDPAFGRDIGSFFNVITGYSLPPQWNRITMAPTNLRPRVLQLIRREIGKHSPQTRGFIRAKMNSLTDPEIIAALYAASAAGVKIELLVRGMCRLRAGVKGLSENIRVTGVIDRFLEHSRIFHFHNGGEEEVYVASADWMERNFDDRLELLFPILDADCRKKVLRVLNAGLTDNVKAWEMRPDGGYARVKPDREKPMRSQAELYADAVREAQPPKAPERGIFVARTRKK